jgi:hypothetical protein
MAGSGENEEGVRSRPPRSLIMAAPGWLTMGDPAWLSMGDPGWLSFPDPGGSSMRTAGCQVAPSLGAAIRAWPSQISGTRFLSKSRLVDVKSHHSSIRAFVAHDVWSDRRRYVTSPTVGVPINMSVLKTRPEPPRERHTGHRTSINHTTLVSPPAGGHGHAALTCPRWRNSA